VTLALSENHVIDSDCDDSLKAVGGFFLVDSTSLISFEGTRAETARPRAVTARGIHSVLKTVRFSDFSLHLLNSKTMEKKSRAVLVETGRAATSWCFREWGSKWLQFVVLFSGGGKVFVTCAIFGEGQNDCNLLLCLISKHVFENFVRGKMPGYPPGFGPGPRYGYFLLLQKGQPRTSAECAFSSQSGASSTQVAPHPVASLFGFL